VASHLKANAYIGLPSYLKVLIDKAGETGTEMSLEKAFVIAEKLPETLRSEFQETHGIKTCQGYGTAEVGAIAYECEAACGMHFEPSVFLEVLDPDTALPVEPGHPGEVVVTVINTVYTLFRFATGDLSSVLYDECSCGRKSPRLSGILGRVDQVTKVRGLFVHPGQLAEVLSNYSEIERYRAIVVRERAMDDMIIELQGKPLSDNTLLEIENRIKEVLKLGTTVKQVKPGTIPDDAPVIEDRRKWD
jgi:phenylacetate-CoA ligase